MRIPCQGAARSRRRRARAGLGRPVDIDGVGGDPGAQDPDGSDVGPVLVVTADGRVLADRPDVIHEHVGSAQLGNRGVERGAQVVGIRGVRDVAADVLAS